MAKSLPSILKSLTVEVDLNEYITMTESIICQLELVQMGLLLAHILSSIEEEDENNVYG